MGHQFKFVIDGDRRYVTSKRYATREEHGNVNNCFMPKEIRWIYGEKRASTLKKATNFLNPPMFPKPTVQATPMPKQPRYMAMHDMSLSGEPKEVTKPIDGMPAPY